MTPLAFAGCFGWLHRAAPGSRGVVMCASWEYEASAIRQTWRVLADRLAEAGIPTLRYDYPGCGDSLGASDAPGAFDAMLSSIAPACDALREHTGVSNVVLVGLRLGASLALLAAEGLDVEAVVLIRPVVRGKAYLVEQRALARLVQTREAPETRFEVDPTALEVEGFRMGPESLDRIAKIDLVALDPPPPGRVLILGEPGSKHYDALREKLVARAAAVEQIDLLEVPGWAPGAVPTPPPLADCDALAARLKDLPSPRTPRAGGELVASGKEPMLATSAFREAAMIFGRDRALAGILCRPNVLRAEATGRAVIFINTGENSHIGAGRSSVVQARDLAELGIASLRMDIAGIGDSSWTREGPLSVIHRVERSRDVSEAIDEMHALRYTDISLVGVCSGAFLAFQTALVDPRVGGIFIANPQFWLPPAAKKLANPLSGAYGSTSSYLTKFLTLATWKRAIRGELHIASLRGVAAHLSERLAARALSGLQRVLATKFGLPPRPSKLVALLRQLAARGCRIRLLLSEGDTSREILQALLPGGDFAALDGLMEIETLKGADHAFVMRRIQAEVVARLRDFLDARKCVEAKVERKVSEKAA